MPQSSASTAAPISPWRVFLFALFVYFIWHSCFFFVSSVCFCGLASHFATTQPYLKGCKWGCSCVHHCLKLPLRICYEAQQGLTWFCFCDFDLVLCVCDHLHRPIEPGGASLGRCFWVCTTTGSNSSRPLIEVRTPFPPIFFRLRPHFLCCWAVSLPSPRVFFLFLFLGFFHPDINVVQSDGGMLQSADVCFNNWEQAFLQSIPTVSSKRSRST